jgi:hypothetical protein
MTELKPLHWKPDPQIGYRVERRPDGGMHYTFWDASPRTLEHWREFAQSHLLGADRLTRNLYDLRLLKELPDEAAAYAVEAISDPAARNIRLAAVVSNPQVEEAVRRIAALAEPPGGVELAVFTHMADAEIWLAAPLERMV